MQKRIIRVLFISLVAGYVAAYIHNPTTIEAQTPPPGRNAAMPPRIPPVANPPLYPDPGASKPMYWSADAIRKLYEARIAAASSGQSVPAALNLRGQSFRTHSVNPAFMRVKFDTPRPSNRSGVMSQVDDADQHQGVSDFYVITGGTGEMMTDGVINNRVYGNNPRGAAGSGAKVTVIYPGEFNGQPIKDGHTYAVKPGDWLAIPPNVPHWPGFNPGRGLMYTMVKINVGIYGDNLMY